MFQIKYFQGEGRFVSPCVWRAGLDFLSLLLTQGARRIAKREAGMGVGGGEGWRGMRGGWRGGGEGVERGGEGDGIFGLAPSYSASARHSRHQRSSAPHFLQFTMGEDSALLHNAALWVFYPAYT